MPLDMPIRPNELNTPIPEKFPLYSNGNISEVLPGCVTPLTWSFAAPVLEYSFRKSVVGLGLIPDPGPGYIIMAYFFNRVYMNLSFFRHMAATTPGMDPLAVDEEFGAGRPEDIEGEGGAAKKSNITPLKFKDIPRVIKILIKGMSLRRWAPKAVTELRSKIEEMLAEMKTRDITGVTMEKLVDEIKITLESKEDMFVHILVSEFAVTSFGYLRNFTAKYAGDHDWSLAARLCTGLNDIESARPSLEMWRVSRIAAFDDELREIFEKTEPTKIQDKIESLDTGPSREFMREFKAFLEEYGHRSVSEAEMMQLCWREDPTYVLNMMRNFMKIPAGKDPITHVEKQAADREAAEKEVLECLNPALKFVFRRMLKEVHTFIAYREEVKSMLILASYYQRKNFREIARRLVEKGILKDDSDIYFLQNEEVENLAMYGKIKGVEAIEKLVNSRREDFEYSQSIGLPKIIEGEPLPVALEDLDEIDELDLPETEEDIPSSIKGTGVSPGTITAKARVMFDPRVDATIEPGEVLVAPVTDAGWAPVFLSASALVTDVGGLLSHGSIVAREYGIPAVVNTRIATKIIKTGQTITVDGASGVVTIKK